MRNADVGFTEHGSVLEFAETESHVQGFRALADPHRLRILYLLMTCGEMCVCEAMLALELSQSNLSFHLKALKQAGFIKARKSGKWTYYSLARPVFQRFLEEFGRVFNLDKWPEKLQSSACDDTGYCATRRARRSLSQP